MAEPKIVTKTTSMCARLYYDIERVSNGIKIKNCKYTLQRRTGGFTTSGMIKCIVNADGVDRYVINKHSGDITVNAETTIFSGVEFTVSQTNKLKSGQFTIFFTSYGTDADPVTNLNHHGDATVYYNAYATQCGAPSNPIITFNQSDKTFTINVKNGKNGTNNPVGGIEVYWKWNSTSVAWNNYSDKNFNNGIGSQGNYSFNITNVPNTAKSIAVIAYTIDNLTTDPNSAITYKTFNLILATFVHLPYRYYFSSGTKNGFKEKNDEIYNDNEVYNQDENYRYVTDENYVSWEYITPDKYKNYKRYINIYIVEPGTNTWHNMINNGDYIEIDSNNKTLDLNNNVKAHIAALQCMQNSNCGYWNNNTTIPWARYLDCEWILQNFIEANDTTKELKQNNNYYYPDPNNKEQKYYFIGATSFKTASDDKYNGRIELTTPPRGIDCIPNAIYQRNTDKEKCEDWGYESNKFDISWKPSMFANQYLLKYYVGVPNSSDNKSINSVLLDEGWKYGYNETDGLNHYTLSIPSLLAGQRVWFSITPRWHGEVVNENQTYSYTYPATETEAKKIETTTTGIQKQGGIIAVDENTGKYQNYHIYVADKNGKPVKAKAAYVYTDKMSDDGKTFEWKLCKTI